MLHIFFLLVVLLLVGHKQSMNCSKSRFKFPSSWSLIGIKKTYFSLTLCILRLINISLQSITTTFCNFASLFGINTSQKHRRCQELHVRDRFPPTVSCSRRDTAGQEFISFICHRPLLLRGWRLIGPFEVEALSASSPEKECKTDESSGWCDATVSLAPMARQVGLWRRISWKLQNGGGGFRWDKRATQVTTRRLSANATLLYCRPIRCG